MRSVLPFYANRSLFVALSYMLPSKPGFSANWPPKRICLRQLSHGRRRPTKQDTKLIALSTVSSIRLVFITVKRTSAFVDRGGNYRCVSGSLDRPPAIIIADQNRSYWELPTKAETTGVNYLDGLTGYEREPFDLLYGVFCQQESNDALILYWDLCAIGFTRVEFLYFIYLFIYYYYFFKIYYFLFLFTFFCLSDLGRAGSELDARRLLSSRYDLFAVVATCRSVRVHFLTEASFQPGADDDNNNNNDSRITGYFRTTPVTLTLGESLPDLNAIIAELNNQVEQFTCRGSGFVLDTVTKLTIVFARFRDLN